MDALDIKILKSLGQNARQKASAISQQINLSVSAVIERIHKLEDSGIIQSYTTVLDQKKLGHDISAWVEVTLGHPRYYDSFVESMMQQENVVTCHYLTGDADFMLFVVARSTEHLEQIHRQIKDTVGVSDIKTYFVLKTVKSYCSPLPELE